MTPLVHLRRFLLGVLLVASFAAAGDLTCPIPSTFASSFNDACIIWSETALPFESSEKEAQIFGGHLSTIPNGFANSEAVNFSRSQPFAIGLQCSNENPTQCTWSDGSMNAYRNFRQGHPSLALGSCVSLDSDGKWSSRHCEESLPALFTVPLMQHLDQQLARDFAWSVATVPLKAADEVPLCLDNMGWNCEIYKEVLVTALNFTDDKVLVVAGTGKGALQDRLFVTFRSSKHLSQYIEEVVESDQVDIIINGRFYGRAERFFSRSFNLVWDEGSLAAFLMNHTEKRIRITGFSLGGGLSEYLVLHLYASGVDTASRIESFVTFGAPRGFNPEAAYHLQKAAPMYWRVVHAMDLIPQMPPRHLPDFPYMHAPGGETWYPFNMSARDPFITCFSTVDEPLLCSDSLQRYSIFDHKYFDYDDPSTVPCQQTPQLEPGQCPNMAS